MEVTSLVSSCERRTAPANSPAVRFPAVYMDLDGTALGPDHLVRPATVAALERYRARGGRVGIATGRTLDQVAPYLPVLKPDLPLVLFNGAVAMTPDGQATLSVAALPAAAVPALWPAVLAMEGVVGVVFHYADRTLTDRDTAPLREALAWAAIRSDGVIGSASEPTPAPPVKILVFVAEEDAVGVEGRLRSLVADRGRVVLSNPRIVEVLPVGANKAIPIRAGLIAAGIDPRAVLVFGDSDNDVEMLSELGVGIAMGNGSPKARAAALLQTSDNASDAIATILVQLARGL